MKINFKKILTLLAFILVIALLYFGFKKNSDSKIEFENQNKNVENFMSSTPFRIANAVITHPEEDIILGLKNNTTEYKLKNGYSGNVTIQNEFLKTKYIPGIFKTKTNPRLDAIVPMYIKNDSSKGSMYIVLFQDRGDAVIEKSYARLGELPVTIENITILEPNTSIKNEEYRVSIEYKIGINNYEKTKKIIIPIIDGHFDPKESISK